MEVLSWRTVCLLVLCTVALLRPAAAIRFVIDREECFSHNVEYEGDTVHVSFVVIKADTPWHYSEDGVDLVVSALTHFASLCIPYMNRYWTCWSVLFNATVSSNLKACLF